MRQIVSVLVTEVVGDNPVHSIERPFKFFCQHFKFESDSSELGTQTQGQRPRLPAVTCLAPQNQKKAYIARGGREGRGDDKPNKSQSTL